MLGRGALDARRGASTATTAEGCVSKGETPKEALAMIREAIEVYLESLEAHGDPIPGPIDVRRWPSRRAAHPDDRMESTPAKKKPA